MGEPRRVVERAPALLLVVGDRDQHAGDRRLAADAAVAGGDAGHVGAVRAVGHLRLALELGGGQAASARGRDRLVEVLLAQLGAVVERRAGLGRVSPPWSQIRTKRVLAVRVEEVLVGEVEAADVDQPDQHAAARPCWSAPPKRRSASSGAGGSPSATAGAGVLSGWPSSTEATSTLFFYCSALQAGLHCHCAWRSSRASATELRGQQLRAGRGDAGEAGPRRPRR